MNEVKQKTKVIIADQQSFFRKGIRSILDKTDDIEVISEVDSVTTLMSAMNTQLPEVLLLDIQLPAMENQDVARSVKQQFPSTSIILITPDLNDNELFQAIRSRASGYVNRNVSTEELLLNIRRGANGEHPINDTLLAHPQAANKVLDQFQDLSWGTIG